MLFVFSLLNCIILAPFLLNPPPILIYIILHVFPLLYYFNAWICQLPQIFNKKRWSLNENFKRDVTSAGFKIKNKKCNVDLKILVGLCVISW